MRPRHAAGRAVTQLDDVAREDQLPRPVEGDLHLAGQRRHLAQVDRPPHEPGNDARNPHPQHVAHGVVMADRRERAEHAERERPRRLTGQLAFQIRRQLTRLTQGELSQSRRRLAILRIRHDRTVAQSPHIVLPDDAEVRRGGQPAPLQRQPARGHQRADRVADRAHDGAGSHDAAISQPHPLLGDGVRMCLQANDKAAVLQTAAGVVTQRRGQLGQKLVATVKDLNAQVFAAQRRIKPQAAIKQVIDLTGHLDAAEPAADHREAEQPAAAFGVGLRLRVLQLRDDPVAQHDGVAQRLERQGMSPRARDDAGIDHHAAGQHKVLVGLCLDAAVFQLILNPPPGQVQSRHDGRAAAGVFQELPDRPDHMQRVDGRPDNFGQHRRKSQEVFLTNENNLPARRQPAFEIAGKISAGKSAADDNDGLAHGRPPDPRLSVGLARPASAPRHGRPLRKRYPIPSEKASP